MPRKPINVLVWSELTEPAEVYPTGINGALADYLNARRGIQASTSQIANPDQGVSQAALDQTDVLVWFGHMLHDDVRDETVTRIVKAVKEDGKGFLGLHSTHWAKPNIALMGTGCGWRTYVEDGRSGRILVTAPEHPIAKGIKSFIIPEEEWYGEPYDVPTPEAVIFAGVYDDSRELVRDGMVWTVGNGRVFYFRPGHETYPVFHMPEVQQIIENGVRWLARRS